MKNILLRLLVVIPVLWLSSCNDDPKEEHQPFAQNVAELIVGNWLSSSSDANDWITYEFSATSRIKVELSKSGYYDSGDGYFSVQENKLTGSYTTARGQSLYMDWVIEEGTAFEINYKLYDNNTYLGESSIYKILSAEEVENGNTFTPSYRTICGSENVSDFISLNKAIASVDSSNGEITGVSQGTAFITFMTPNGHAAIKIEVTAKKKTFTELVVGTWIYDNLSDKEWQRAKFIADGYIHVEWATKDSYNLDETAQGNYTINDHTVKFTVSTPYGIQFNQIWETEEINDFTWTYKAFSDGADVGKYTAQKLLESVSIELGETYDPNYKTLIADYEITGYSSHNKKIADVNSSSGQITAISKGRTYIDVITSKGAGVIEVNIEGGAIPYDFQDCIGQSASKVRDILGSEPYYEDETIITYKNLTSSIDLAGVSIDSWTGLVKGIAITYNSTVNTSQVTSVLDATFIPFESQTTETFKAYMDSKNRADATVGVTWNIATLQLTYVNLATDLFRDYSVLMDMTKQQVLSKMGKNPDSSNEQSQSFFFYDKKGVSIVSAYYTDFINVYDKVVSVVTMLDGTQSVEDVTSFLKKKYSYYPEYSSESELVFISEGHKMEIYYTPADKMIMYISVSKPSNTSAKSSMKRLRRNVQSLIRK